MHGDEGELKPAGEETEHQQHVGAVAEGFALSACLNDCCCMTGPSLAATAGVASASDNGITSSIRAANTVRADCQPKLSISATPKGANRNCPNEPAAVPAPSAMPRHSGGI